MIILKFFTVSISVEYNGASSTPPFVGDETIGGENTGVDTPDKETLTKIKLQKKLIKIDLIIL